MDGSDSMVKGSADTWTICYILNSINLLTMETVFISPFELFLHSIDC